MGELIVNKTDIMKEIDAILAEYCEGCFLKIALNEEKGKTGAHYFCIKQCTVGDQLKFLGQEMNKLTK